MNNYSQSSLIKEQGFAVYRSLLSPDLAKSLKTYAEILVPPLLKRHGKAGNYGYKLYRSDNLMSHFPFPEIFEIDLIYDDIVSVMGEDFDGCQMFLHFSVPGNGIQHLHADAVSSISLYLQESPPLVALHIPLCKFDKVSGGMRIIPGTQLNPSPPMPDKESEEYLNSIVEMLPGDILIRDCRAWHGACVNQSDTIRPMFSFAFVKRGVLPVCDLSPDLYFVIPMKWRKHFGLLRII